MYLNFLKNSKLLTLIFIITCVFCLNTDAQFSGGDVPALPGPPKVLYNPNFARFVTDNPALVLRGGKDGLQLVNLESKSVLDQELKDEAVSAVRVHPVLRNEALVATVLGNVYNVYINNENLKVEKIQSLSSGNVRVILQFMYYVTDPDLVAAIDELKVHISKDGGKTWNLEESVEIPFPTDDFASVAVNDYLSDEYFLISTAQGNRFRFSWLTLGLKNVPEVAKMHAYRVGIGEESCVWLGDNANLFPLFYPNYRIMDLVFHPQDRNRIFTVGIGKGPLLVLIQHNKWIYRSYGKAKHTSYSLDIDFNSPQNLILTSNWGLYFSKNGGKRWKKILS